MFVFSLIRIRAGQVDVRSHGLHRCSFEPRRLVRYAMYSDSGEAKATPEIEIGWQQHLRFAADVTRRLNTMFFV